MAQVKDAYDKLETRCFQLGDLVPFKYCRTMNQGLCCPLVMNCWVSRFPLDSYLVDNFSENELDISIPDWKTKIQKSKERMHAGYFGGIA
jgi:hypothetical protein